MVSIDVPIKWIPADERNILARPSAVSWEAWVLHTSVGCDTIECLGGYFGVNGGAIQEGRRASTHFGVDDRGETIGQYVSLTRSAIAHGNVFGESKAKLAIANGELSANHWAAGIEHIDRKQPGYTTPAMLRLSMKMCGKFWIEQVRPFAASTEAPFYPDRDHVLGHYQLAPSTRTCPEWPESKIQEYIAGVVGLLQEVDTVPVEPPPIVVPDSWPMTIEEARALGASINHRIGELAEDSRNLHEIIARWERNL